MKNQAAFSAKAEEEMARIMEEMKDLHKRKSTMPSDMPGGSGYTSYQPPRVKQREFRIDIGVVAFVIEEQIDHRVTDRQMRHELFVLTDKDEKAERKAEDHGYTRSGGAFLTILDIKRNSITINTKGGKQVIEL